jgi:biopolymer transport protein ExbD
MRFKGRLELEHGIKQIDIAPFMSIIFLLLIFIMLSSSFITQPGIKINLPRVVTSELIKSNNIEIIVNGENEVYLNNRIVSTNDLKALFKQTAHKNETVLIKSDKHASLGVVAEIWDLARSMGIAYINIATNQE